MWRGLSRLTDISWARMWGRKLWVIESFTGCVRSSFQSALLSARADFAGSFSGWCSGVGNVWLVRQLPVNYSIGPASSAQTDVRFHSLNPLIVGRGLR